MFNHRLEHQGRTRGFLIETRAAGGWDVLEEQDRRVVREVHYDDWHRVERQLNVFALRVEILKNEGWVPIAADINAAVPLARHAGSSR
jgi:23S rRNA A2030 N6-methylase RlmJ